MIHFMTYLRKDIIMAVDLDLSRQAIVEASGCMRAGPYSLAMQSEGFALTSGQIGLDEGTGAIITGGLEAEVRQVFRNLGSVLEVAGLGFDDVLKANVFLTDISDFAAFNDIYAEHFSEPYPARTTIGVASLPLGALVEVELIVRTR
jgi:2-iminobutanoate/2-iminopropanoate deaminase